MVFQCEVYLKTIHTDKTFDMVRFINSGLNDFLPSIVEYLNSFHDPKKKKSVFGVRHPDSKGILSALEKVFDALKDFKPAYTFKTESIISLNQIFCYFLHPQSPGSIRSQSVSLFLKFLQVSNLTGNQINQDFSRSLNLLVPFTHFTKGPEDPRMHKFETHLLASIRPVTDSREGPGDQKLALKDLNTVLRFLVDNWIVYPQICYEVLYHHILCVVYKQGATEAKFTCPEYAFDDPISDIHDLIIQFFTQIFHNDKIMGDIMQTIESLQLYVHVLDVSSKFRNPENHLISLQQLSDFLSEKKNYLKKIEAFSNPSFFSRIVITGINNISSEDPVSSSPPEDKVLIRICTFVDLAIPTLQKISNGNMDIWSELFSTTLLNAPFAAASILVSMMVTSVNTNTFDKEMWKFISNLAAINPVHNAIIIYFILCFAVYIFPLLFDLNVKDVSEICINHTRRKQRTKQSSPADFVAENIQAILDTPDVFVRDCYIPYPSITFKDQIVHPGFIPLISKIKMRGFHVENKDREFLFQLTDSLLSPFSEYNLINDSSKSYAVFSPILAFALVLSDICIMPPGIQYDKTTLMSLTGKRLIKAVIGQPEKQIRSSAFLVLSNMLNTLSMKTKLNDSILTNWYACLIAMILSPDQDMRDKGFNNVVSTIDRAFFGSELLIPFLITVIEQNLITLSGTVCGFLASFPLFTTAFETPKSLIDFITSLVTKNPESFIENANQILSDVSNQNSNLRDRVLTHLFKLVDRAASGDLVCNWQLVLPTISALVADEVAKEQPDAKILTKSLDYLLKAINSNDGCFEAIMTINSMIMYIPILSKVIKNELFDFINTLTDKVLNLVPDPKTSKFAFKLIKLMSDIYINSFSITQGSEKYTQYIQFLEQKSKKGSKEFDETIQKLMENLIILLSVNYGNYPYPNSNNFPTNTEVIFDDNTPRQIFTSTKEGSIFTTTSDRHDVRFSVQTGCGHYVWHFNEINVNVPPSIPNEFNLQPTTSQDTIPPISALKQQTDFATIFNETVSLIEKASGLDFPYAAFPQEIENDLVQDLKEANSLASLNSNYSFNYPSNDKYPYYNTSLHLSENFAKPLENSEDLNESESQPLNIKISDKSTNSSTASLCGSHQSFTNEEDEAQAQERMLNEENIWIVARPRNQPTCLAAAAATASGKFLPSKPECMLTFEANTRTNQLLRKIMMNTTRFAVKIGVVFVGEGNEHQNDILRTTYDEANPHFKEFITGLGWPIILRNHTGYDGGLDLKGERNGRTSIYFADSMNEMMFHIAPLLPTDPKDEQQIYKKRHIGNDHTHIIYSQDMRDYDTTTITSQFNQAHIMIYPLQTALFRVETKWRSELKWFCPLRYSIITGKKALPSLVRATSMQAMNSYTDSQPQFTYPQDEMRTLIDEVLTNVKRDKFVWNPLKILMISKLEKEKKGKPATPNNN